MSCFALPPYHNRFPNAAVDAVYTPIFLEEPALFREAISLRYRLDADKYSLVGWSYGGLVAWMHALCFPDRVTSLTLIGTIPSLDKAHWRYRCLQPLLSFMPGIKAQRLSSMATEFPSLAPNVPTRWFLGKDDPFHDWQAQHLPVWEHVLFFIVEGGQFPDIPQRISKRI